MRIETSYWYKVKNDSRFIIIATHAAGDDMNTWELWEIISHNLWASLVVNNKFIKRTNSRAKNFPEIVENFNNLPWNPQKMVYEWNNRKPEMKDFFSDIDQLLENIEKPIYIHIHWMKNWNSSEIDVWNWSFFDFSIKNNSKISKILWQERLPKKAAMKIVNLFQDNWIKATCNKMFAWCFKISAMQYFNKQSYSLQMEFSYSLRKNYEEISRTAEITSIALKSLLEY